MKFVKPLAAIKILDFSFQVGLDRYFLLIHAVFFPLVIIAELFFELTAHAFIEPQKMVIYQEDYIKRIFCDAFLPHGNFNGRK